jgi:hypoxanthine phosphoribosyltransferase
MEYKKENCNRMSWKEFDILINGLAKKVDSYFKETNQKIDLITPLHRTGGIVAGIVAIKLRVIPMLPIQFKHSPEKIDQISELPEMLINLPDNPNILFCEGNTSAGSVSKKAAKLVKEKYPNSKIYLATLTKVYGGAEEIEGIDKIFYGILTNENYKATDEESEKLGLREGVTIFPWEKEEDELYELNK